MSFLSEFVLNFWYWWYVEQFLQFVQKQREQLLQIVFFLRLDISFRYLFTPLYGDNSILGRLFALVFRCSMLVVGTVVLAFVLAVFVCINVLYLILPIFPLLKIWQMALS